MTVDSSTTTPTAVLEPTDDDPQCGVCPHPWSAHDTIGARFCTATGASSIERGCVCR